MILHVAAALAEAGIERPIAVVSLAQPDVERALEGRAVCVPQTEPLGTGHALASVPAHLRSDGPLLVLGSDVPLLKPETLAALLALHSVSEAACTLLSFSPLDRSGLGRIVRDERGQVQRIVEEADLRDTVETPVECNAGVYVFDGSALWPALSRLQRDNAQGEYYLTDVVEVLGGPVQTMHLDDPDEAMGVNDRRQLSEAEAIQRRRVVDALMLAGVTIRDPVTTYIDSTVDVGADTVIEPMSVLRGRTVIGAGCTIGPMAQLRDVRAGDRVHIGASHLEECVLEDDVKVGSYDRVRPNTVLGPGVELGTHAEVKNSTVGAGTRIGHFSCVLDSDVGRHVNIGAGAVTCNFDGASKHRTVIGDRVFVGTNATLVAPVRLGDGAYVAAGSFIDSDVPADALAVGRTKQRNVERWSARRRGDGA